MKPHIRLRIALALLAGSAFAGAEAQQTPRAPIPPRATEPPAPRAPKVPVREIPPDGWQAPAAVAPVTPLEPIPDDQLSITVPAVAAAPAAPAVPLVGTWSEQATPRPDVARWDVASRKAVSLRNVEPGASWAPADTADSLYRAGRDALNRSEYRVAARLFRELRDKHPRSQYVAEASYWEAFSLYRIGTNEDLRTALDVLAQTRNARFAKESMQADVVTLAARIQGALARRGDPRARAYIDSLAKAGAACDREELEVRTEALSALAQMDEQSAGPALRRVLANRDACTAALRRRAVYLLVRNNTDSSTVATLVGVAQTDPELDVRVEAVNALSRLAGTLAGRSASAALQELLQSTRDERVQVAVVRSLANLNDWSTLRAFVERTDPTTLTLRVAALSGISRERSTPEDAAWLRALYARSTEPAMKEAVASAIGRIGGEANEEWLITLAGNAAEPVRVRATAISRLSRSTNVTAADLAKIYDAASERQVREQVLRALAERKEPEALDKLIEVVRTGTDPVLRSRAINHLTRFKSDPRVQKLFEDLIGH